jgi:hypothetical protein
MKNSIDAIRNRTRDLSANDLFFWKHKPPIRVSYKLTAREGGKIRVGRQYGVVSLPGRDVCLLLEELWN